MENVLYDEFAGYYNLVSDDRRFWEESQYLVERFIETHGGKKPQNMLELFAGPAYHSEVFSTQLNCRVTAVDSSESMKKLALESHQLSEDDYIVGAVPEILKKEQIAGTYDLVLIMRYSLGLISYEEVETLMQILSESLSPGGMVFIELHNIEELMSNFESAAIRDKTRTLDGDEIELRCIWPSENISWDKYSWKVNMPIKLELYNKKSGVSSVVNSCSEEYIYTLFDIQRMVKGTDLVCTPCEDWTEKHSVLVSITKEAT